jgi:hypothetical protein
MQAWPHVINPVRDVVVAILKLQPAVVIEFEVVVRVDETGQHVRAVEIHDHIVTSRRLVHAEHIAGEAHRRRDARGGDDFGVDERDR